MKLAPIAKYALDATRVRGERCKAASGHARKHPQDPDAIHDLRVAIRRFVQCLRVFEPLFDPASTKKLRKRLRKVMDLCAAARNCDVALSLLAEIRISSKTISAKTTVAKLTEARASAEKELHRRLKKEHRRHFPIVEAAAHRPDGDWKLEASPAENLRRILPALAADFFRTGMAAAVPHAGARSLHQFRLRAKRFRYTLELFEGFYGAEMAKAAETLKGLQDHLGAINDCATTIGLLGHDRRARAAIRKLMVQRKAELHNYWKCELSSRGPDWWNHWLSRPIAAAGAAPRQTLRAFRNGSI